MSNETGNNETAGMAAFAEALAAAGIGAKPSEDRTPAPATNTDTNETTEEQPPAKPKRLADLAPVAKLSEDELYAIEVPSAVEGAEPYTLGKLKDLAREHDEFTVRQLETEQRFRDRDAQLLRAEQELRDLFAALPEGAIKPELRQQLQAKRERAIADERRRVLEVVPEWQNRDVRTQEIGAMVEHLKDYGFPESYLAGVTDHRTLRYIRNNMMRDKRIAAALEKVTARKASTPPKGAKPAAPTPKTSKTTGPKAVEQQRYDNFANLLFMNTQKR